MRNALPGLTASVCLFVFTGACEAPATPQPVGAAEAKATAVSAHVRELPLPDAVIATLGQLREIAATGSYRDMAVLADATPGFRSNTGGMSHSDYWRLKLRAGDWPMAHMEQVLDQPMTIVETERGKVYLWPRFATLRLSEISYADAREIDRLVGQGTADALEKGAYWPGYVLGIAEDGTWLYFMSGAG